MKTLPLICALLWTTSAAFCSTVRAQSNLATFVRAYVGSDGLAHLVDNTGKDQAMPKEKDQVAVSTPKLAADKQIAGWLIEQDNWGTSYPIPTALAVYKAGKTRVIGNGLMIYDWRFVGEGARVALSTGTVHGMTGRHLTLYDALSGRLVQEWTGDSSSTAPVWAKDLNP